MFTRVTRTYSYMISLGAALAFSAPIVFAEEAHHSHASHAATQPAKAEFKGDPYLLATDPVTGDKLPQEPIVYKHEGRELRFTDQKNLDTFKANPTKYLPRVDELMVKQQLPFYAIETCPVSDEKLGGMGKPVDFIYKNRLVRFCCSGCIETFQKDPSKHVAKLNEAAVAKQGSIYPLSKCVVSGEKLGDMGKPADLVVGNRLVRLCCAACDKSVNKDPLKYLKMIDEAAKKRTAESKPAKPQSGGSRNHGVHNGHEGHQH